MRGGALRLLRGASFGFFFALSALVAGCGQPPPEGGEQGGGNTGKTTQEETTGETTTAAGSSEFQGIVDSYAVAREEIEDEGGETEVGPYRVGYIVEPAEGWWEGNPEAPEWRDPSPDETHHLEILPFDPETGLLIPEMEGRLTVLDEAGEEVDSQPLYLYYAEFYHYANNFSIPESGTYTLRAELEPPDFNRHGSEEGEGRIFTAPVTVEFENVEISTEEG
jgi:Fe2+ transport protein